MITQALPQQQQTTLLDLQAKQLAQRASATAATATTDKDDAKALKAGKDFESILVGSWLQQAENSFASVPGGDEDEDADAGKDQFQGIAMQALATSLTKGGAFGIAKMITQHLEQTIQTAATAPQGAAAAGSATTAPEKVQQPVPTESPKNM